MDENSPFDAELMAALREALREEAEKIAARGDNRVKADLTLLLAGAMHRLGVRTLGVDPPKPSQLDRDWSFSRGYALADKVPDAICQAYR